ncbi:MAG: gamma-glutamyl-gamma-aminobutyrate hydrolase family protein [Vulcanimicrobiaceae bacterium]
MPKGESGRMRIGISYHPRSASYENYPRALAHAARHLELPIEAVWLGAPDTPFDAAALAHLDGLVLTGGGDVAPERYGRADAAPHCRDIDPERDRDEWAILDALASHPLPTLAICRGAQLLNVYHGGTLIPNLDTAAAHAWDAGADRYHRIEIVAGSLLHELAETGAQVNSAHHQAVDALAPPFAASAFAPDGCLEAYEWRDTGGKPWLLAVQWHPERYPSREQWNPETPLGGGIFRAFLQACAAHTGG